MEWIVTQHPDLDIRMVFSRAKAPIRKGSKTTYADVCDRLGIKYAEKCIPHDWFKEPVNKKSKRALEKLNKQKK